MKHYPLLLAGIVAVLFLTGCDGPTDPAPLSRTAASIASPDFVGYLPDGRAINCIRRDMGGGAHPHYIYFVGDAATTNHKVTVGKTTRNDVTVEIGGVKYVPLEKQ